jgi:hypothetical protein
MRVLGGDGLDQSLRVPDFNQRLILLALDPAQDSNLVAYQARSFSIVATQQAAQPMNPETHPTDATSITSPAK